MWRASAARLPEIRRQPRASLRGRGAWARASRLMHKTNPITLCRGPGCRVAIECPKSVSCEVLLFILTTPSQPSPALHVLSACDPNISSTPSGRPSRQSTYSRSESLLLLIAACHGQTCAVHPRPVPCSSRPRCVISTLQLGGAIDFSWETLRNYHGNISPPTSLSLWQPSRWAIL